MPGLLVTVRFHDNRYHGSGDWPPSPARLFQALVVSAAGGEKLSSQALEALYWLEGLEAPIIAAPSSYAGQSFRNFVPNNDLDAVGGDPARVSEIRTAKLIHPRLFSAEKPLIYAWTFDDSAEAERHASTICEIAENLYQLGRGVDMAWATGEVVSEAAEVEVRLRAHGGVLWKPSEGGDGNVLLCPHPGSLASLLRRFEATRKRFQVVEHGRRTVQLFRQAPKASFKPVDYNSPPTILLFDIRQGAGFAPQPVESIVALTERIRDGAAARLRESTWRHDDPKRDLWIDKIFVGRQSKEGDKARRIRITPLPSVGHEQADRLIRRVLVTVPPDCPISTADIAWAFSGTEIGSDPDTGEFTELVAAADSAMPLHYGAGNSHPARLWRTVTPAALPEGAARRRIDPRRRQEEAKAGSERVRENARAAAAVRQALRHVGILTPAHTIRVQREPFEGKGRRAESFAIGTRFNKERLWHVEISFAEAVQGPLLIGDGRYLGLGLMAPVRQADGIIAFAITAGLERSVEPGVLTRALRRAIMARVQERIGRDALPRFFTGHTADGTPSRPGRHEHLAFAFDEERSRLLIFAPHVLERREASKMERDHLRVLEKALDEFRELRAGSAGKLTLVPIAVDLSEDPLFMPSLSWESVTPYQVTRHAKLRDASAAVEADLLLECQRAGLPWPDIEVLETFGKPGLGLFGRAKLRFRVAVAGPVLLGRDRHFGGGLFGAV